MTKVPIAQGDYLPAVRHGDLIFTSGMTPRQNGLLIFTGPVKNGAPLDAYHDAVHLACRNALAAARSKLTPGEQIASILSVTMYVAAEAGFVSHSKLADFASEYLRLELGVAGIGARAAVGVATLPGNAPVEIQLVAAV